MTEELPLPPEVRAVQADALRPLESPWVCDVQVDGHHCPQPAKVGGRTKCCQQTALLCFTHMKRLLSDFAAARLTNRPMPCPFCHRVYPQPVAIGEMWDHSFALEVP